MVFNNSTAQSFVWIVGSTDDADEGCVRPESGPLWSTFTPSSGLIPAQAEVTVVFDLDIDGRGLPQGAYREYGCIFLDDVAPLVLPIDLVVSDTVFGDGFEPPTMD
ncbi:MAG: hypothetical protein AB8B96_13235 [Lysobacterales bacterium]